MSYSKDLTDRARKEFLAQDELTLWKFIEGVVAEAYEKGIEDMKECKSGRKIRPVRNPKMTQSARRISPKSIGRPLKNERRGCKKGRCKIN